jgi:hypothetical protein
MDVDEEGAAGDDVLRPRATGETTGGTFAGGDSAHRPHRGHRRGTGDHAAGGSEGSGPRLAPNRQRLQGLTGQDANLDRL